MSCAHYYVEDITPSTSTCISKLSSMDHVFIIKKIKYYHYPSQTTAYKFWHFHHLLSSSRILGVSASLRNSFPWAADILSHFPHKSNTEGNMAIELGYSQLMHHSWEDAVAANDYVESFTFLLRFSAPGCILDEMPLIPPSCQIPCHCMKQKLVQFNLALPKFHVECLNKDGIKCWIELYIKIFFSVV